MKYYLRCLLYNKEVAALVSVLGQPSYLGTWKLDPVPLAVVTSASSKPFALPNLVQFPPSITSISRSVFANSHALAKSFSAVVFLVRLFRQFGLTGRKAAWRREFPLVTIGTLRSNDADGKKNIKKNNGFLLAKQQLCKCTTLFCTFLCPFLHDYNVNMPNFAFYGGRKQATTKFLLLFLYLDMVPRNSTPGGFAYIWQTRTTTTTTSLFLTLNIQIPHHLQIARLIEAGGV